MQLPKYINTPKLASVPASKSIVLCSNSQHLAKNSQNEELHRFDGHSGPGLRRSRDPNLEQLSFHHLARSVEQSGKIASHGRWIRAGASPNQELPSSRWLGRSSLGPN